MTPTEASVLATARLVGHIGVLDCYERTDVLSTVLCLELPATIRRTGALP